MNKKPTNELKTHKWIKNPQMNKNPTNEWKTPQMKKKTNE